MIKAWSWVKVNSCGMLMNDIEFYIWVSYCGGSVPEFRDEWVIFKR